MATRLKKILKEIGISQQNLADSIGINPGRLSLICNGKDRPRRSEISPIEDYFLLPIDELIEKERNHVS